MKEYAFARNDSSSTGFHHGSSSGLLDSDISGLSVSIPLSQVIINSKPPHPLPQISTFLAHHPRVTSRFRTPNLHNSSHLPLPQPVLSNISLFSHTLRPHFSPDIGDVVFTSYSTRQGLNDPNNKSNLPHKTHRPSSSLLTRTTLPTSRNSLLEKTCTLNSSSASQTHFLTLFKFYNIIVTLFVFFEVQCRTAVDDLS